VSGLRSRNKGKSGEREAAELLRGLGFQQARRGVQYQGGAESPDVVGVPGVHFEVKRTESLSLYPAMRQAIDESAPGDVPVVLHRRSREDWLFVVPAAYVREFVDVMGKALNQQATGGDLLPAERQEASDG